MKHLIFTALFLLSYTVAVRAQIVFPTPNQVEMQTGNLILGKKVSMYAEDTTAFYLNLFREEVLSRTPIKWQKKESKADICWITDSSLPPEGYRIKIHPQQMVISASDKGGFTYAVQTLRQWAAGSAGSITFACASVTDYPRTQWRCFLLDSGRQFQKIATIRKYIDMASLLKMNYFHWHLTEDQGWRIEIKKYPRLTSFAAWRPFDKLNDWWVGGRTFCEQDDPRAVGGYYTQDDIREVVAYAAERHITIIPEIEMPGHASAAIAAYPQLGTEKQSIKVPTRFGVQYHAYNVADPKVIQFIKDVLDEVCNLFPSETIHIGGDEVPKGSWTGSPLCHKFMEEKGMKDTHELSEYFLENITEMLSKKGVKTSGWQEVALHHSPEMNARIAPRFAGVYCWSTIGKRDVVPYTVANEGYDVILCNVNNLYIDLAYNPHKDEPGLTWGGYVNEFTSFNILPYNIYCSARENTAGEKNNLKTAGKGKIQLTEQSRPRIKGVQAQLFSETIGSFDMVQYYVFPKIFGLVERGWNAYPEWSPVPNDDKQALYEKARAIYNAKIAEIELPRLAADGFNFRVAQPGIKIVEGKLYANSPIPQAEIRYTTDGSEPTATSTLWEAPVDCSATVVKAKLFYLGKESLTTDYKND